MLSAFFLGLTVSTVGEELKHNPRLTKSKEEFVTIMTSLGLVKPKKMGKIWTSQTVWSHSVCTAEKGLVGTKNYYQITFFSYLYSYYKLTLPSLLALIFFFDVPNVKVSFYPRDTEMQGNARRRESQKHLM